jgi:large subunit ribosomal protein L15
MPLQRRVPKRGFTNPFRVEFKAVNLRDLERFEAGASIGPEELVKAGLAGKDDRIKLLAMGDITRALTVRVHRVSGSARTKVEAAGGAVELI